jgi:hypothetical protein
VTVAVFVDLLRSTRAYVDMAKQPAKKKLSSLDAAARPLLKKQIALFKKKFGREPRPDEPLFFDADAAEPRRLQLEPMEADIIKAMKEANIHPRLIYAFEKTGRLLSASTLKKLSKADQAEWHAALAEYDRKFTR